MSVRLPLCFALFVVGLAAAGPAAAAELALPCAPLVPGTELLLTAPAPLVALGAFPGAAEPLRALGALACHAAQPARPVIVALELDPAEQPRVDAYLASAGTDADRRALLAGPFWTTSFPDGHQSQAAFELLDEARALRARGADIRVAALEAGDPADDLDKRLAARVVALRSEAPTAAILLLASPLRTRVDVVYSLAGRLRAAHLDVVSVNTAFRGGTTWGCLTSSVSSGSACRIQTVVGSDRGFTRFFRPVGVDDRQYDGVLYLGDSTASPPAVAR